MAKPHKPHRCSSLGRAWQYQGGGCVKQACPPSLPSVSASEKGTPATPRGPVLCPGVQGSLQVHIPWPLQECSQVPAPAGPQSPHLPNGYNHPHPTQLIRANGADSTLERRTQRPHFTNEEDSNWTREQEQREKPQKGGVRAQGCASSPVRKRRGHRAGRTAPAGGGGGGGPSSAVNRDSGSSPVQSGYSPCLAPPRASVPLGEQARGAGHAKSTHAG